MRGGIASCPSVKDALLALLVKHTQGEESSFEPSLPLLNVIFGTPRKEHFEG